jgi:hypothetical protein
VPRSIAQEIMQARRFVLDDTASSFMADLAHASYAAADDEDQHYVKSGRLLDQARQLSRAPHALTWFEYDHRVFRKRVKEVYEGKFRFINAETAGNKVIATTSMEAAGADEISTHIGHLLRQESDTQFLVTTVVGDVNLPDNPVIALPFSYAYTTDDSTPTHPSILPRITSNEQLSDAYLATGVPFACKPNVVITATPDASDFLPQEVNRMLVEFVGDLRYVWALLAAINDVPIGIRTVEPSKGFVAKGRYRHFLTHKVLSILIPKGRDPIALAKQVVALSRRRAHQVRGHWRRDWRHEGNRIWIHEHERGDSKLGYVTHDYKVEHEET